MTITPHHLLDGVHLQLIPGGESMPVRRLLVIHYTEGATAQSSINYWNEKPSRKKDLGAHLIIDRDGTVTQCRPFNRTISHAGVSRWRDPKTGILYRGLNSCAIGIELANGGNVARLARSNSRLPMIDAVHRNKRVVEPWEQYTPAQIAACTFISKALVERYNLDDITGHDCVAPERKIDPGPAFPMKELRESCGFSGLPEVFYPAK